MRTLLLLFLALALPAAAADRITLLISVTNSPTTNGMSLTINGGTRTWTNSASGNPSVLILATNEVGFIATNLFSHLASYPPSGVSLRPMTNTTTIVLVGQTGGALTASKSGDWGSLTLLTNTPATMRTVRVPFTAEDPSVAAANADDLISALETFGTSKLASDTPFMTDYLNRFGTNTYTENTVIFGGVGGINAGLTNGTVVGAAITESTFSGTVVALTNGVFETPILVGPIFTNAVNYGNPFNSPGTGNETLQMGQSAEASADNGTAVGDGTVVQGIGGSGFGSQATVEATAPEGVAIAFKASVSGGAAIAIGTFADARKTNTMALGVRTLANHDNSIAIANDTTTTTTNQIRLGNSLHMLSLPGNASFGQRIAAGSDNFLNWPASMNRGLVLVDGAALSAGATNSWVLTSVSGEAFYRTGTTGEGFDQNNRLHNRADSATGTGTDFTLNSTYARVDFSGQDPELTLPTAGTYVVSALVEVLSDTTPYDVYAFKFRNFTDDTDVPDSERGVSNIPASGTGQVVIRNLITITSSKVIHVWGINQTAARGTVRSTRTSIFYERLY